MTAATRNFLLFLAVGALILTTGLTQSWVAALAIVNMGLISAVMALGVNIQWGYAGLHNVGIDGFRRAGWAGNGTRGARSGARRDGSLAD